MSTDSIPLTTTPAVVATVLLVAAVGTAVVGASATGQPNCSDGPDRTDWPALDDVPRSHDAGFEGGPPDDWTGGTVFPIGADRDCSLGVAAGERARLDATVQANGSAVVGTLDVGSGGALELDGAGGGSTVRLRNVDDPNDRTVALVVERGDTRTHRRVLRTDGGRFFDYRLRWLPNGTVRLTLGTTAGVDGSDRAVDLPTNATTERYRVGLSGEAYLDRVAVVRRADPTPTPEPGSEAETGAEAEASDEVVPGEGFGDDFDDQRSGPDRYDTDRGSGGEGGVLPLGVMLLLLGAPGTLYPYKLTRLGEQLDAIGSTTPAREVEPARWNVLITRIVSGAMVVFGSAVVLGAVL